MDPLQNRRFVRGFRRFLSHVTKCHACHGICTLSQLRALWQCDSRKTRSKTRPKCCAFHTKWHRRCPKCCACHDKCTRLLKATQKYWACHTQRFLTRYETCWNVTKCHACHAKWSYATRESAKRRALCRTSYRHDHSDLAWTVADVCGRLRTVADGCGRLRNVWRTQLNPHTPRVKREPFAMHSGKRVQIPQLAVMLAFFHLHFSGSDPGQQHSTT